MNFKTRAFEELRARRAAIVHKYTVAGLDGFVDTIVTPVALRSGHGENFTSEVLVFGRLLPLPDKELLMRKVRALGDPGHARTIPRQEAKRVFKVDLPQGPKPGQ